VGGVNINTGGIIEVSFTRGLSTLTNNQVEAYALLKGLKIVINSRIEKLIVVGDSKNAIRHMVLNTILVDSLFASLLEWAKQESKKISDVNSFHALRENNSLAHDYANQTTYLKVGDIVINANYTINLFLNIFMEEIECIKNLRRHMENRKAISLYGSVCYEKRLLPYSHIPKHLYTHEFESMGGNSPQYCGIMALWFGFLVQRF